MAKDAKIDAKIAAGNIVRIIEELGDEIAKLLAENITLKNIITEFEAELSGDAK